MIPWILLSLLPVPALAETFGVHPKVASKYAPSSASTWTCLDGSKEIAWAAVNDDYCDCLDGSDEPGTGACPNTRFYCQNIGHIGASIPASRVKDGLCEPECCDGSDERPGVCPNICKQVGEDYRKKRAEQLKIQKTGSKIRSSYISFAQKEKTRLEGLVESTAQELLVREKEVARLKDLADRAETLSAAAMEHKQQSPLYISLLTHASALRSLQREHKKHLEREKTLGDILDTLRAGYNPNYQDMAVLEAVRGWESLAGLPPSNDRDKDKQEAEEESNKETEQEEEEVLEDGDWTAEELEKELDELLDTDYVSLLLEHDDHVKTPVHTGSILFDVTSYLPDSVVPQYEEFKDAIVGWLEALGIIRPDAGDASDSSRARQAYTDAENALNRVKSDAKKAETDLADLFNPAKFGSEGEWKKLDKTCISKDTGDYTYELCFFGEAKQKPNKGGSTFSLGKFHSWDGPSKQVYNRGTKCWNGPERSVQLLLTCGTENALLTVAELEKCEYRFTGTSPALCLPPGKEGEDGNGRDEL